MSYWFFIERHNINSIHFLLSMSKNILIIGGNSEIGKHLGKLCHNDAYSLYVTSRSGQSEIEGTQIQCDPLGDLSVLDELPESLDGFVYCPGTINLKSLQRMTLDDLQNDMNINFFGAFNTFKHVLSKLKKDNGASAVFFSTVAAQTGMTFHSSIAAAKGALESFAKASAAELAPRLAINVIAPSITKTPMASNLLSDDKKIDASADRHPLKEIGSPEQVAKTARFLLDAKENWITGQIVNQDGGMSTLK